MASAPSMAFLLVQLLLLLSSFQEASCSYSQPPVHPPTQHHHHNHHVRSHPPVYPPVHPPSPHHSHPLVPVPSLAPFHPPAHPPVKPPVHPPVRPPVFHPPPSRSFIAVQGLVYCKSCKDTLYRAKPIFGAQVKLLCKNTRHSVVATAKTDKNGYFFLQAPKTVTSFAFHKCKVYLVSSPLFSCREPSNLNGGLTGASLRREKPFVSLKFPFILYSVRPLAFQPMCKNQPGASGSSVSP